MFRQYCIFGTTLNSITDIQIAFSDDSLLLLNICLGFIMFGIALGIDTRDFKGVSKQPRGILAGVISQFLLLPAFTFLLIILFKPNPAFALGLMLVACCPGGNVSNFISHISGANAALSVALTGLATLLCPLFTPLNFELWTMLIPDARNLLRTFNLNFYDILITVITLLLIPLIFGLWFRKKWPKITLQIEKPIRIVSFLILMCFIGVALAKNFHVFSDYISAVFLLVFLHNTLAFGIGYLSGKVASLSVRDLRSVTIETGIQNSGLGLIIVFTFFNGNGAMALIAAWWGVWHIISGISLAGLFHLHDKRIAHSALRIKNLKNEQN